jgi:hypothetical protein
VRNTSPIYLSALILLTVSFLLPLKLDAQPQILPSIEIGSDDAIKAPLLAKPVFFPEEAPADSLPSYLPPVFPVRHAWPALSQGSIRPLRMAWGMDTSFRMYVRSSLYPETGSLDLVKLEAEKYAPGRNRVLDLFSLQARTIFGRDIDLNHNLAFLHSSDSHISSTLLHYGAFNKYPLVTVGRVSLRDIRTWLTIEGLTQDTASINASDVALGIRHSHTMSYMGYELRNELLLQNSAFGVETLYRADWAQPWLPELYVGLMTDFIHILPAISAHKRIVLAPDRYVEIANRSTMDSYDMETLTGNHPWTVLPARERVVLRPLDLSVEGWQAFHDGILKIAGMTQNLSFSYNEPYLKASGPSGQTSLHYTDILGYQAKGLVKFKLGELALSQDLRLNLEYLQDENWRRKPYSPLISANTSLDYGIGDIGLKLTFNQSYGIRDANGARLKPVPDLSASLGYPLNGDFSISASLRNIFNVPYPLPGNLPESGRTFSISFHYLP